MKKKSLKSRKKAIRKLVVKAEKGIAAILAGKGQSIQAKVDGAPSRYSRPAKF